MKSTKVALIGCGRIGFLLEEDKLRKKPCTHWGGAKAAGIKINYACDTNEERLNHFAKVNMLPPSSLYKDYTKLLKEVKPDIVIIATWTNSHAAIAMEAANNNCKIIICEKPISSNLKDAKDLLDLCNKNSVKLIINHERRYDPKYIKIKEMLTNNKIGEIKSVYGQIFTGGYHGAPSIDDGGGPLLHDGTHLVDLINYFFGPIKSVYGKTKIYRDNKKGFEDHTIAWLETESDIDIILEVGGKRKYFTFQLNICGTDGEITAGNGYERLYKPVKSRLYKGFRDLKEVKFSSFKKNNYFTNLYKEAKTLLTKNNVDITSTGINGYNALEIIHAIYYSSYKSKKITLPINIKKIKLNKIFNI